jgi:general stress protein YciG
MAGTAEGARKTREANLAKDPNFYKKIGAKSWQNPDRDHEVGFAKIDKETHIEISKKGGSRTKKEYHKGPWCDYAFGQFECGGEVKAWGQKCKKHQPTKTEEVSTGVSE